MRIIFFGTPEFAAPSLKKLFESTNIEILAVVTQEDKPAGRKQELTSPPVKILAQELKIKVLQPKSSKEMMEMLAQYKADFFVVIAYGNILPQKILEMPKHGAINVHGSMLPKYRGASPIQESLLNGDEETGISIMEIDNELDHGGIYLIKRIKIDKDDTYETLSERLAILSAEIIPIVLTDIMEGILTPISQDDKKATFCRKIEKEEGKINWNKTAAEINNMIRAYTPWPSAYAEIYGKKVKIIKAGISEENLKPGELVLDKNQLKIGTKKGILIPKEVQPEGKKAMDIKAFVNGLHSTP